MSSYQASDDFIETVFQKFSSLLPAVPIGSQRIYLLRHGETEWNRLGKIQGGGHDIPLNADGKHQADAAARLLSHVPLDVVVSSRLQRARITADIVHAASPTSPVRLVDERFGEMRFGDMEGMTIRGPDASPSVKDHVQRQHKEMRHNKSLRWEGPAGESIQDVEQRARSALNEILANHPEATHLAFVAHGRTNKILLRMLLSLNEDQCDKLVQGNACVNVLDRNKNDEYTSRLINFVEHTEKEVVPSGQCVAC